MASDTKRILFYDVDLFDASAPAKRQPVKAKPAFEMIKKLPAIELSAKKPSRYMAWGGDELLMEIFSIKAGQVRGAFAIKRRTGLPRLERAGKWSNLRLQAGQGLAYIRHFVYWTDRGLLGVEVNSRGPGIGALSDYLKEKAGASPANVGHAEFTIYLASDQFDRLNASSRVSTATIGVRRDSLSAVSELDQNVHDSLDALAKSGNARELRVEMVLGDRRKGATLHLPFLTKLKKFTQDSHKREALTMLKAYAKDPELGEMRTIDLLEDRFVGSEQVVVSNDGVVDQDSMLDAIDSASDSIT